MRRRKYEEFDPFEEYAEDTTLYGEFIPSFDAWIPPDFQRQRAKFLGNITNDDKRNNYNR